MQTNTGSATERESMARGLSKLLADTHALHAKTCRFHRDVGEPEAAALRPVLEQQRDELRLAADLIAERMSCLGVVAPRPPGPFAPAAPHQGPAWTAREMIRCLTEGHEMAARRAHAVLRLAEEAHDSVTCDCLGRRVWAHEKAAWVLAAIGVVEFIQREL
jgi:starvation-inducible DNA-binding protein